MTDITLALKSSYTVEVTGESPERFLNAAAAKGIYISDVQPIKDGLRLRMSRRAYYIMAEELPQGLSMGKLREHGAPRILRRFKKRFLLLGGIPLIVGLIALFSQFVWRVEISGGNTDLQKEVAAFLEEKNVRSGVTKRSIDQTTIKREAILSIDDLLWLWVDIKGTTAYVNIAERNMPPEMTTDEPSNVIASESGVVEKITTLQGTPMVSEGETVEKGSILISGAIESERIEETMFRHGEGVVIARVWR
ncbi:MAG: sporulation protein YqfD, partial [Clostridia bacterium]